MRRTVSVIQTLLERFPVLGQKSMVMALRSFGQAANAGYRTNQLQYRDVDDLWLQIGSCISNALAMPSCGSKTLQLAKWGGSCDNPTFFYHNQP